LAYIKKTGYPNSDTVPFVGLPVSGWHSNNMLEGRPEMESDEGG